jgi:DNA-directed RNA polymerase specialized sigma24 family protein
VAIHGRRAARETAPPPTPSGTAGAEDEAALDEALMVRVTAGEQDALAALYDRFERQVYSLARRICGHDAASEDVVQDVFLEVWRRAERFDPARGSVATWLLTLTHQTAVDAVRRGVRRPTRLVDDDRDVRFGPDHTALALAFYDGHTQAEVAAILGIPLGTVKSRTAAAVADLREQLRPRDEAG